MNTEVPLASLYRYTVHGAHHMDTTDLLLRTSAVLVGTAATLYLDMPVLAVLAAFITVATGVITLLELNSAGQLCLTRNARELVPVNDLRIDDVVHDAGEHRVTGAPVREGDFVAVPAWSWGANEVMWFPVEANASITARCEQNSEA